MTPFQWIKPWSLNSNFGSIGLVGTSWSLQTLNHFWLLDSHGYFQTTSLQCNDDRARIQACFKSMFDLSKKSIVSHITSSSYHDYPHERAAVSASPYRVSARGPSGKAQIFAILFLQPSSSSSWAPGGCFYFQNILALPILKICAYFMLLWNVQPCEQRLNSHFHKNARIKMESSTISTNSMI